MTMTDDFTEFESDDDNIEYDFEPAENVLSSTEKKKDVASYIHPTVAALPDDNALSAKNVKLWLKLNKDRLKSIKSYRDSPESKLRQEYQITEAYIKNLQTYLRSGAWLDMRYGANRENKHVLVCVAPAYDKDGNMKLTHGTIYRGIGLVERIDNYDESSIGQNNC